jgi:hypothetical protein
MPAVAAAVEIMILLQHQVVVVKVVMEVREILLPMQLQEQQTLAVVAVVVKEQMDMVVELMVALE